MSRYYSNEKKKDIVRQSAALRGKEVEEFCKRTGVSTWSVYEWRKRWPRLAKGPTTPASGAPAVPKQRKSPSIVHVALGELVSLDDAIKEAESRLEGLWKLRERAPGVPLFIPREHVSSIPAAPKAEPNPTPTVVSLPNLGPAAEHSEE